MNRLELFLKFVKAWDWVKAFRFPVLFTLLYSLLTDLWSAQAFVAFALYGAVALSYAFSINNMADYRHDLKAGKKTVVKLLPKWFSHGFALFAGAFTLLFPVLFGPRTMRIGGLMFLTATLYSVGPFRLKERGFLGPATAAFGIAVLPFSFFVAISGPTLIGVYLAMLLFLGQLSFELYHQYEDYGNDKKSGTRTWAVHVGKETAKRTAEMLFVAFSLLLLFSLHFGFFEGIAIILTTTFTQMHQVVHKIYLHYPKSILPEKPKKQEKF